MSFDDACDTLNSMGLLTMDAKCYRALCVILTQICYSNTVYIQCINEQIMLKRPEWLIFFLKWFAIRFDEAFDSIENMTKYCEEGNKQIAIDILRELSQIRSHSKYRTIAQSLRNTIHYSVNTSRLYLNDKGYPEVNVFKLYAEKTNIWTWSEIENAFTGIRNDLFTLEKYLRQIFS